MNQIEDVIGVLTETAKGFETRATSLEAFAASHPRYGIENLLDAGRMRVYAAHFRNRVREITASGAV
jgi:hypothetical protein